MASAGIRRPCSSLFRDRFEIHEMIAPLVAIVGLLLAFANGANDNFKGVATLAGSGTTSTRRALLWATVATALGSITALVIARGLLAAFSGKGLVPPELVGDPGNLIPAGSNYGR
jgi:PiT family inorganic phosphate transporter